MINLVKAFIEQIESDMIEFDYLDISNKPVRFFSIFSGYKQLGKFSIKKPHNFKEREWVDVDITDGRVVAVRKLEEVKVE